MSLPVVVTPLESTWEWDRKALALQTFRLRKLRACLSRRRNPWSLVLVSVRVPLWMLIDDMEDDVVVESYLSLQFPTYLERFRTMCLLTTGRQSE